MIVECNKCTNPFCTTCDEDYLTKVSTQYGTDEYRYYCEECWVDDEEHNHFMCEDCRDIFHIDDMSEEVKEQYERQVCFDCSMSDDYELCAEENPDDERDYQRDMDVL